MIARVWGARGSQATPGSATLGHGGNTSCVEVVLEDGTTVIFDAGTGIRELGLRLAGRPPGTLHLCLTHLHLDHVEGLGFFEPLWSPGWALHVWGPPSATTALRSRISRYLSPPLFPVALTEAPARVEFHDAPDRAWPVGSGRLLAQPIEHRGPTVGYRLEAGGRSLVYMPDHEPYLGAEHDEVDPEWLSGWTLARGADVLLHDAQYTEDEYPHRVGWGHSSVAHAVRFARAADVGRLVLFHHDPMHSDEELAALHARAGELWNGDGEPPLIAHEGMELELATVDASPVPRDTE